MEGREDDVREVTEGQQVGEAAQHLNDFEVLSLARGTVSRGTVSTPWADISLLIVLNSITRGRVHKEVNICDLVR